MVNPKVTLETGENRGTEAKMILHRFEPVNIWNKKYTFPKGSLLPPGFKSRLWVKGNIQTYTHIHVHMWIHFERKETVTKRMRIVTSYLLLRKLHLVTESS